MRETTYRKIMIRRIAMLLIFLATPAALAADSVYTTGIVSTEPAMVFFAIAAVLIAGLLLRRAAGRLAQVIVSYIGELRVRRALGQHGSEQLHDVIVPGAYGGLARIDHAILTSGGILCIRTVHCHGIVFGGQDDAQWTHVDGISRRRFLNPLIQNEGRSRALRNVVPDVPVANLVVFTGNVEFPNPLPANVIRVDQIDDFLAGKPFGCNKVRDWDAAWMSVQAAVLGDEASRRDFNAQLSFS
jgi:hypothetical protein